MPLPLALAPPPHLVSQVTRLDEPIRIVHGLGPQARTDCMAADAVRADGKQAIARPAGVRLREAVQSSEVVLQDHVALVGPGRWTVRVRPGCDEATPWVELQAQVRPAGRVDDWDAALRYPSAVGVVAHLQALIERAPSDPRALEALAAVPDPRATDALFDLRDHEPHPRRVWRIALRARRPAQHSQTPNPWAQATWRARHSRAVGLLPSYDPGVRVIRLPQDADATVPTVALDEPIYVQVDIPPDARFPGCIAFRARGPGGEALVRPQQMFYAVHGSTKWSAGDRLVLQDYVVLDQPGLWHARFYLDLRGSCPREGIPEDAWTDFRVHVGPPDASRQDWVPHPYHWGPLALPAHRQQLETLADQGLEWAVRAIGGIPDPEATDVLVELLDHPRKEVARTAGNALADRVPSRRDDEVRAAWSAATFRPRHAAALHAWSEGEHRVHSWLVSAWNGTYELSRALAERDRAASAWQALEFHRWRGRKVELDPASEHVLDLIEAARSGRELSPAEVLRGLDHPMPGARAVVVRVAPCTPQLATVLPDCEVPR